MHIYLTYHDLTYHVVPGPQSLSYFVPLLLLPVALLIPRSILSRWQSITIFMTVITLATADAWRQMGGVDVISVDLLLWALFLLVLRDPWKDFVHVRWKEGNEDQTVQSNRVERRPEEEQLIQELEDDSVSKSEVAIIEQPYPPFLLQRLPWVGRLLIALRFNDWRIGRPSHDAHQPPHPSHLTRTAFITQALIAFARGYLALDLTRAYIGYDAYFTDTNVPISSHLPFSQLTFLPPQLLRSAIIGIQAWATVGQMFYLPCLLPIALNAIGILPNEWSPHTWTPYFGSIYTVFLHGVRGFWGQYWHQTMRFSVSEPGYAVADLLRLRAGGLLRYTVISISAFTLSGIVHMGLVPPEPLHATIAVNAIRLRIWAFFGVQPIAFLVETLWIRLLTRWDPSTDWNQGGKLRLRMLLNVLWVIAWFSLSLPLLGEVARQLGYWRVWPLPVSVWRGLRGEGWVTWSFLVDE